jgi:hypothetical protein
MTDTIRTVQFTSASGTPYVGLVTDDSDDVRVVDGYTTIYDLAMAAIEAGDTLAATVKANVGSVAKSYDALVSEKRLLPPVTHPTSDANFLLTGTGLTHIGSASTRNSMHHGQEGPEPPKSDSMRLYEQGLKNGKPKDGTIGAMPEWFYKGDAGILVNPEAPMSSPNFARSCAEEPEITGVYIVGPDGTPWRLGYTIANDLSDHETERLNFMYVAPSKLRDCSMGPELFIGALPGKVEGMSRVHRDGAVIWEGSFESGDECMSYSIANLEHHHFRHPAFCRPGDLHAHFFGCPVMSFGAGFKVQSGDVFEFDIPLFGKPLRNPIEFATGAPQPISVKSL